MKIKIKAISIDFFFFGLHKYLKNIITKKKKMKKDKNQLF
jgi:hypothetical protein